MGGDRTESSTGLGVVGEGSLAERIATAAPAESVVQGSATDALAAAPEAVVAVGESALFELVRERVSVPVLPVAAGPGYCAVPEPDAVAGVESLLGDEFDTVSRMVVSASVGRERAGRALADVMVVTSEPARISEYAVRSHGEEVGCVRADGVVVSTPVGSHGYGRSAGGPLLEPGTDALGVVPVAPFAVNVDSWVLDATDRVELTVERDEGEVSLLLDDRIVRPVPIDTPVEVVRDGAIRLARVAETRSFFAR
ncbi:NAD(+)/NADH kinase [Halorussus amylolyticus]|uniref:NAD(+)/NADH kinase n=1 Tax=Halorussus amylolyticus TaxID=1126242 RepID=UPI00138EF1AF|nr:NAD(+)/NADH kinase [Halorussus amylolyticus]